MVVFQRGACDGLNVVVPYAEPNYYALRPNIAIKQNEVLDLNGFFGLHPAMASMKPLYDAGHLAVVHAAGSPDGTRSHFDAQDYMESGTPGVKATTDGWLNRALQAEVLKGKPTAFRAVALGTQVPRTLQGKVPAVALANVGDFSVAGKGPQTSPVSNAFEAMYDGSTDSILHGTGQETFEAVKMLKSADPAPVQAGGGGELPEHGVWQQSEAGGAVAEGEPRGGSGVFRHRRVGYAPEPGCGERAAGQPVAGIFRHHRGVLARHGG